jgi:protein-tyrosine phosphatase
MSQKIDVHSHLLPGIDDGCKTIEESIACAKLLVEHGYTHSFCTPHIWKSLPANTVANIPVMVAGLQTELEKQNIPLKLIPGGENNIQPDLFQTEPNQVVTCGMNHKHILIDFWSDRLPDFFTTNVTWLQSLGLTVILAHPERMRAVQDNPEEVVETIASMGVLMQGNLACFSDAPHTHTRRTAELMLSQDRYFCVGSDLHNLASLPARMYGLKRVEEVVANAKFRELTWENPKKLIPVSLA